ncbi:SDR family NAD(P)-dependent oxidoreductase [Paraglaciecola chathamensis]|uniref:Oxidoreductase n=1 Tax=Paraglaciecola chathamensis TaxID=368405 RepID=A0A8H9IBL2_9ALTE|nr:SDR family oxidoreductase [Paraglaciecola oceanifecundans]GGZ67580.1 putative oxidoreductase [Paraglaciecola oceanifecundans]
MNNYLANPASLFDLKGKVALITGATGAFGQVAARVIGNSGCNLLLTGGNKEALETLAESLRHEGVHVATRNTRPNSEQECDAMVEQAVSTYGKLDILVVGSGVNDVDLIQDMSTERWQKVMDANVRDSWLLCKAAGKQFMSQGNGGKVVLVSSARGKLGHPAGYSAYCPSKSAVDGITRALGCEWGKHNITVNAIAPTVFRSNLTAWMFEDNEPGKSTRENILARIPMGRLGEPEDLAGPLLFLASDASSFHTGHVIYADGGYSAG